MNRSDALLVVVVGCLGSFVAVQLKHVPARAAVPPAVHAHSAPARLNIDSVLSSSPDVSETLSTNGTELLQRDPLVIRARIAAASGTYMPDMFEDLKHQLVRWPDRRDGGLRVWVQTFTPVPDFDLRYAQMARDAVADWSGDGFPLRFDFVLDSASADIRIMWLDRFPPEAGRRVGTTKRRNDRNGWLSQADISVAIHDSAGATIRPVDLAGIVRHEAGHALGLGHSRDPKTKMYPVETVNDITPTDRATLRLLYQLPPGALP
ncbi:MAG TPA: matrixin family metalloprotease [Gemmatimonadaceae bacterium]|nr:matrixin family metalloprotease [Gemmatimonadaceae bacterium]